MTSTAWSLPLTLNSCPLHLDPYIICAPYPYLTLNPYVTLQLDNDLSKYSQEIGFSEKNIISKSAHLGGEGDKEEQRASGS